MFCGMNGNVILLFLFYYVIYFEPCSFRTFTEKDLKVYRVKVSEMFRHAYDSYLNNAFPFDELKPLSCEGVDTWGSFSLTLIDALDTLVVMKNYTEFKRVVDHLVTSADFNININVSVFETNIRVVGGLISAHLLSRKAGMELDPGWPCSGPLLQLAESVARRLLPAFKTKTGMPYGTVNLRYGVPPGETPITCTAGVSTFIVEFGTLSRLTGDPIFENVALNALHALWERRSSIGLVGNHINVQEGKWTAMDAGIGGGIDSYYEYLVKGSILFQEPLLMRMFSEYKRKVTKYMKRDDWHFWVSMGTGQVTMPLFQSLETFWPGLLSLVGDIDQGLKTLYNYHQLWKQYGFIPEFYDVPQNHIKRDGYPLRPELIESVMYLYRATKDPHLLEIGVDILESIEHSAKTQCGYATVRNIADHKIEDRMESFFLAETTKYLYLLFDPENFIHNNGSCGEVVMTAGGDCLLGTGGYIFNTEAHPIDIAAVYCCSVEHMEHRILIQKFKHKMDLHSLLTINEHRDFLQVFRQNKKRGKHADTYSSIRDLNSIKPPDDVNSPSKIETVTLESSFFGKFLVQGADEGANALLNESSSSNISSEENNDMLVSNGSQEVVEPSFSESEKTTVLPNSSVDVDSVNPSAEHLRSDSESQSSSEVAFEDSDSNEDELDVENVEFSDMVESSNSSSEGFSKGEDQNLAEQSDDSVYSANNGTRENYAGKGSFKEIFNINVQLTGNLSTKYNGVRMISLMKQYDLTVEQLKLFVNEVEKYRVMSCPAQSFVSRLSKMGEMFNTGL